MALYIKLHRSTNYTSMAWNLQIHMFSSDAFSIDCSAQMVMRIICAEIALALNHMFYFCIWKQLYIPSTFEQTFHINTAAYLERVEFRSWRACLWLTLCQWLMNSVIIVYGVCTGVFITTIRSWTNGLLFAVDISSVRVLEKILIAISMESVSQSVSVSLDSDFPLEQVTSQYGTIDDPLH